MPDNYPFDSKTIIKSKELGSLQKILTTLAAFLVVIIGTRYVAQDLIAPILLAFFFAILMFPIFKWFRKRGFSGGVSLFLMLISMVVIFGLIVLFFTWSLTLIQDSVSAYVEAFKASVTETTEAMNMDSTTTQTMVSQINPDMVMSMLSGFLNGLSGFIYYFVLIPIISMLLILQVDAIPKKTWAQLQTDNPNLARISKFSASVMTYAFARLEVNIITGLLCSVAFILMDIEFPFVWGLLVMILSFIPYLGIILACIPPVLLSFATGGLPAALLTIGVVIAINLFAENVIEPFVMGSRTKISAATIVVALIFWSWMLGFVGALLAVPLTVLMKTILEEYAETRWVALLMEGNYEEATTDVTHKTGKLGSFIGRFIHKKPVSTSQSQETVES
jgi:predicted PurR-regulated permease PerM